MTPLPRRTATPRAALWLIALASLAATGIPWAPGISRAPGSLLAQESGGSEVAAAAGAATTPAEALEDAIGALEGGDYETATSELRELLDGSAAAPPEVAALARRALADALAATGRYEDAVRELRAASDLRERPLLLNAFGRVLVRQGRLAEAEKVLRESVEKSAADPVSPAGVEALNRLGDVLRRRGRVAEAGRTWNRIIDIYQEMSLADVERLPPETFVEMGLACMGLNRYRDANSVMFAEAQDKDEGNPALLLALGQAFFDKYDYPHSRERLRELLEVNRNHADALVLLADNELTDFQLGTRRYDLAEKHVKRALATNPHHAGAHIVRGLLLLSDGYTAKARVDFEQAVELDPSSLRARGLVATCLYLAGDEEGLRAAEREALEINPRGAEFFHAIALAIERRFRYADVVRFCDRALDVEPEYWPAYATLAVNCMRVGQDERGREFLEKSWKNDPYNVWVFNTRKLVRYMDRNYRTVATDRFVFRLPKDPGEFHVQKDYLVPLLETAYGAMSKRYGAQLEPPIHVEAFSAHKWFSARTVGLEGFAAAGACFGRLVTLATPKALPQQNFGAVAWHEFAHVVTLGLTNHHVPRWLTEGLSVYEEGHDHPAWRRNFDLQIADAHGSGRLLGIAGLDFGFSKPKYPGQILMSYFQGCLIVEFIEERWSWDKILEILAGYRENRGLATILRDALGLSVEEFDRAFFAWLDARVAAGGYTPRLGEERAAELELAVETDPKNVATKVDLAWAYFCTGDKKELDSTLTAQKVLEQAPGQPDAHAILGFVAQYKEEKPERAKEHYEKALAGKTRFAFRVEFSLGALAEEAGDKAEAIRRFEAAKKISPRTGGASYPPGGKNLYYRLGALYTATGDADAAVRQMIELRPHAPEDPVCRAAIVEHYSGRDDEEARRETLAALSELIWITPYEEKVHARLAAVAGALGQHEIVVREYDHLLRFPSTNPLVAYVALARAHLGLGDRQKAAEFARKALELDEDSAGAKEVLERAGGA